MMLCGEELFGFSLEEQLASSPGLWGMLRVFLCG